MDNGFALCVKKKKGETGTKTENKKAKPELLRFNQALIKFKTRTELQTEF